MQLRPASLGDESMANAVELKHGSVSITGNFRENNEDNFAIDPDQRFFLVADGMGGQSAGEKASELAIELISERLDKLDFESDDPDSVISAIDDAVSHANMEIMALGNLDPSYHNMGTTIVFIVAVGQSFYCGGVGDSRVYLQRKSGLEQLTTDHSLTQALIEAGTINEEEAATHRYKNVLYRYLGTKEGSNGTEPKRLEPQSGDRFMLCSDGVTDGVTDGVISTILSDNNDPQAAADALVKAAENGGSKDNITCVVIHVV